MSTFTDTKAETAKDKKAGQRTDKDFDPGEAALRSALSRQCGGSYVTLGPSTPFVT